MGPIGIVAVLPGQQCGLRRGQVQVAVVAFPELLGMGTVGPFYTAVELGTAGWQHEQVDAVRLAGRLKAGHELAAAVDLDSPDNVG